MPSTPAIPARADFLRSYARLAFSPDLEPCTCARCNAVARANHDARQLRMREVQIDMSDTAPPPEPASAPVGAAPKPVGVSGAAPEPPSEGSLP